MQLLKERIRSYGRVLPGDILNVGTFLNQQLDIALYNEIGKEFARRFADAGVTRILTIEASGIGVACITAQYFNVPVVFAKKERTRNLSAETADDVYNAVVASFTHGSLSTILVPREYIHATDTVLLIDDFLANGCALEGLVSIVRNAGASIAGAGVVIEKGFQGGGDRLREHIRVESLAVIERMSVEGGIVFKGDE